MDWPDTVSMTTKDCVCTLLHNYWYLLWPGGWGGGGMICKINIQSHNRRRRLPFLRRKSILITAESQERDGLSRPVSLSSRQLLHSFKHIRLSIRWKISYGPAMAYHYCRASPHPSKNNSELKKRNMEKKISIKNKEIWLPLAIHARDIQSKHQLTQLEKMLGQ